MHPAATGLLRLGSNRMVRQPLDLRRADLADLVAAGAFCVIHCGTADGDTIADRLPAED